MSKHHHHKDQWPIWKITLIAIAGIAVGAVLLWMCLYMSMPEPKAAATAPASPGSPADPTVTPSVGLTHILLLLCLLSWAVGLVFTGLLIHKLYMRIPAWKRRQMFGRAK